MNEIEKLEEEKERYRQALIKILTLTWREVLSGELKKIIDEALKEN